MRGSWGPEMVLGKAGVRHLVTTGQSVFINRNDNEAESLKLESSFFFFGCVYVISLLLNIFATDPL